jgi:hypothetical protein
MASRTVIVAGATGLVGNEILSLPSYLLNP